MARKVKVKDKRLKLAKALLARFPSAVLLVGRVIKTLFPFKDTFGAINQRGTKRRHRVLEKGLSRPIRIEGQVERAQWASQGEELTLLGATNGTGRH